MSKSTFARLSIVTFALMAACGGDSGTGPESSATAAEVQGMSEALDAIFADLSFFDHSRPALAALRASETTTESIDESGDCPAGGTVALTGSLTSTETSTTSSVSGTINLRFTNCKAQGNGDIYTFSGPGLTMKIDFSVSETSITFSLKETGTLNWSVNGKSDSCTINITASLDAQGNQKESGTICGRKITA